MFKKVLVFVVFVALSTILNAQVLSDFEGGDVDNWRSEGDGYYKLSVGLGNPGDCLKVHDYATGSMNYAIAPLKFTGDWSSATSTDSLYFDLKVVTSISTYCSDKWVFEISGPGGKAQFTPPDPDPSLNVWTSYSAKFDSLQWAIIEGNWIDILADIDLFRIRAEYISGDEYVLLDNILLSITPIIQPVIPLVITDFEDGTHDGWFFEDTGSVTIESSGGNPGKCCKISDKAGVTSQAVAPPKFTGDWTQLDESAAFMFDLKINQETVVFSDYLIKISGPYGEAVIPMDNSLSKAYNKWETFSFLISDTVWTVNSRSWDSLLTHVEEVRLITEFSSNLEVVRMDNVRISDDKPIANFTSDELIICPGGSVQFEDTSINAPIEWHWDFGDNQTSTEENPIHTYDDPGVYDVQLIVTNHFGIDTLLVENYIRELSLTDSIFFCDDFDDDMIHPFWESRNGTWSESSGNMMQTSNYYGTGWKNGCFAYTGCLAFSDYEVSMDFKSTDNDGIGAVFYYQDENNFYLFVWRAEIDYRALLKYEDGVETELASDAVAYTSGTWYTLDININSGNITCSIDDMEIFNVFDTTFSMGKAGLYCWANQNSYWDNFCINKSQSIGIPQDVDINMSGTNVTVTWDPVPTASSYSIYSSTSPYEEPQNWTLEESGITDTTWTEAANGEKKFYYVKALR